MIDGISWKSPCCLGGQSPAAGSQSHLVACWLSYLLPTLRYLTAALDVDSLKLQVHLEIKCMLWRFFGEGNGTPLQYSCLENPMDGGAWWAAVHGVAKSQTQLSDLTFTFHFHAWEREMATHSSVLAWKIPGTGEPGGCRLCVHTQSDMTERLHFHFSLFCTGEGNGNPLQCSCLENPRDRGAWWAAVYRVAQSWTQLK